jgi:hypothetical protein
MVLLDKSSHLFGYIKITDSKLLWVNGFVLLMITITPFPTAILAEYLGTDGKYALSIFGFNYFMIALASYWLCAYSYNNFLIDNDDREFFYCIKLSYAFSIHTHLCIFSMLHLYTCSNRSLSIVILRFCFQKNLHQGFLRNRKNQIEIESKNLQTTQLFKGRSIFTYQFVFNRLRIYHSTFYIVDRHFIRTLTSADILDCLPGLIITINFFGSFFFFCP